MKGEALLYRVWSSPRWTHFVAAFVIAVAAVLTRRYLDPIIGDQLLYQTYTIPIALAAFIGGLWPGLLATTISFTFGTFQLSRHVDSSGGQITPENVLQRGVSFIFVWLFICVVCDLMRNAALDLQRAAIERDANRLRLERILDRITDGFVSLDFQQRVRFVNQAFLDLVGAEREDVIGKFLVTLDQLPHSPISWANLSQALYSKYPSSIDESESNGGGRWFHLRLFSDTEGDSVFIQDITGRKLSEKHRETVLVSERVARSKAEEANRLKDELVAVTSHELRTPLTTMLGWAEILSSRNKQEDLTEGLDHIQRSTKLLAQLIDDLLDMSRIATRKLHLESEVVDICELVEEVVQVNSVVAEEKGINLVHTPCTDAHVMGDPARLMQVFSNLLSNALKFTQPGGSIEITAEVAASKHVCIRFQDTGEGIEPSALKAIFMRFRQANSGRSRKHGGLGLGLAIAKEIIEIHDGTLEATSQGIGTGSTFTVTLPITPFHKHRTRGGSEPLRDLAGVKVLIVDDDEATRTVLETMLTEAGAAVEAASSGTSGLELLSKDVPDVVVSDIGMPDMDGYQFLAAIRNLPQGADISVIAFTAFASDSDRREALRSGFDGFLAKPLTSTKLIEAIVNLVEA